MPQSLIVSATIPTHDREIIFPHPNLGAGGAPPFAFPAPAYLSLDTNPGRWSTAGQINAVGASSQVAGAGHHGIFSPATQPGSLWAQTRGDVGGSRAYGFEGLACPMTMLSSYLAAGVALPSIERVYRLRIFLFTDDPITLQTTRILMTPFITSGGAAPNRVSNAVGISNKGGFGIGGDGAGQWQYQSYNRAGINLFRETVALPAHDMAQVNCFEAVRINATSGADASWVFRWNGEDFLSRDYTGVLLEPPLSGEWSYAPVIETIGTIDQKPFYRFNCRWGRFLPTGVEVTG